MVVGRSFATYKLVTYRIEIRIKLGVSVTEAEVYHRSARVGVILTSARVVGKLSAVLISETHHLSVNSVIGLEVEVARNYKFTVGEFLDITI